MQIGRLNAAPKGREAGGRYAAKGCSRGAAIRTLSTESQPGRFALEGAMQPGARTPRRVSFGTAGAPGTGALNLQGAGFDDPPVTYSPHRSPSSAYSRTLAAPMGQ